MLRAIAMTLRRSDWRGSGVIAAGGSRLDNCKSRKERVQGLSLGMAAARGRKYMLKSIRLPELSRARAAGHYVIRLSSSIHGSCSDLFLGALRCVRR